MANYANLIALVNDAIKTNGKQAITGQRLQSVLGEIIGSLGTGYQFIGIATPETNPGTPDQNVCYLAGPGEYVNFGGLTVDSGELAALKWDGTWSKQTLPLTTFLTVDTSLDDLQTSLSGSTFSGQFGHTVAEVEKAGLVRYETDGGGYEYYLVCGTDNQGEAPDKVIFINHNAVWVVSVAENDDITGINNYPIGIDAAPTENSTKPVSSGGVYTALAAKQDVLTFDDVPTENSNNPVKSGGINAVLATKQDKDTNAVAGNVAVMDANGNSKGSNVPLDNVAKIDGQYDTLTSGYAGNLIDKSDAGSEQQIMFRKTGGTTEVSASTRAMFKRLLGRSLVWNQMRLDTVVSQTSNGITIGYDNATGCLTFTGTATNTTFADFTSALDQLLTVGHKYYMHFKFVEGYISGLTFGSTNNNLRSSNSEYSGILVVNNTGKGIGYQSVPAGTEINAKVWLNLIDLTVMYGAGYEPATVAGFESVYNKPYYPHNAGTFVHNVAQTYEAIGQNQWDEEWEEGGISPSTGQNSTTLLTNGRPKNYIRVLPSTKYYFYVEALVGSTGNHFVVFGYDANKNYLGSLRPNAQNSELTLGGDVCYIRFHASQATFAQNICINLSNADINGTYAPYVKVTATLGLSAFRVKDGQGNITTINGLKGTGIAYNEIDVEEKKYIERVAMRAYQSGDDSDTSVLTDGTNTLAPLAEPVIYDLVDDVPTDCQTWGVGTENILPEGVDENGVPKTTPLRAVIYYPKDYTGIINNLPKNYISTASLTNMLNALKSARIIRSFTMTWNAETQMYNFTIS